MWTDINTKPKQGAIFREFRGHVMGILADYNDNDYQGKVKSKPPISSMLPVPPISREHQMSVLEKIKQKKP
jgi:hypothetical protein